MSWKVIDNRLTRTYQLEHFTEIVSKLSVLVDIADKHNHHPDFTVFEYNKIRFELWTHYKNAMTDSDYKLAEEIDHLFD